MTTATETETETETKAPTVAALAKAIDEAQEKVDTATADLREAEVALETAERELAGANAALAERLGYSVEAPVAADPAGAVPFKDADIIAYLRKADGWVKRAQIADSLPGVTDANRKATREAVGLRLVALTKVDKPEVGSNGKDKAMRRWATADNAAEWTARDEAAEQAKASE